MDHKAPLDPQGQLSLDEVKEAVTQICEKEGCDGFIFEQGTIMKKTSVLSKVGQQMIAIPIVYCIECHTPLKESCPIEL